MFGRGLTKLQPAYVEDVAEAIVRTLKHTDSTFEFGGPRVYSYEEVIKVVACGASIKPRLIPVPFAAWHVLAWLAKMLPKPPITQNQVERMQIDTMASSGLPGFKKLGITPVAIEEILQEIL
jgi:nucleoside-diphosphate-sugar epimerase